MFDIELGEIYRVLINLCKCSLFIGVIAKTLDLQL